jgi:hypothetical protein
MLTNQLSSQTTPLTNSKAFQGVDVVGWGASLPI